MHLQLPLIALVAFSGSSLAKQCTNFTIPLHVNVQQGHYNLPKITTNGDVALFSQNLTSIRGTGNFSDEALLRVQTVNDSFSISATYCTPDTPPANPVLQILTHGLGFDKSYWDFPFNAFNYSYVDVATADNYSTLAYDRLGCGNTSHPDPVAVVQFPAELDVLHQINLMARQGKLPGVAQAFKANASLVNVGHSWGSQLTYGLSSVYPNDTDAIVLTGFSVNGTYGTEFVASLNNQIAALNQPLRFGITPSSNASSPLSSLATLPTLLNVTISEITTYLNAFNLSSSEAADVLRTTSIWDLISGLSGTPSYSTPSLNLAPGYLTWAVEFGNQYNFLYPPGCDPAILPYTESTKQPYTIGEMLTLGNTSPGSPISKFRGPVLFINGNEDSIMCDGNCSSSVTGQINGTTIAEQGKPLFPLASSFQSAIIPNTGHAINVHYNAVMSYRTVQAFFKGQGISST